MVSGGVNGTVCNEQQYQQSLTSLTNPHPTISCLTRDQSFGLVVAVEASLLSLIFVVTILGLIGRNALLNRKRLLGASDDRKQVKLLETPTDIFLFSLFICELLQALGGLLNIRWVHNGIVKTGSYCTAQGIILQGSQVTAALITLFLAIYTFVMILWSVDLKSRGFSFSLVGASCIFSALWVGNGNGIHKDYEEPTPFWCWINLVFVGERLAGEYVWLWITLFASVIMYISVFSWTKGWLSINMKKWYMFQLSPDYKVGNTDRRAALGLLLYPLAYSFMVLPLSIARWSVPDGHKPVPSVALFFGFTTFCLSGVVNVSMFWIIRQGRLLFAPPQETFGSEIGLQVTPSPSSAIPSNCDPRADGVVSGDSSESTSTVSGGAEAANTRSSTSTGIEEII
ncbi:hypothetical protein BGW80DRAFT_1279883 [Lactifluus volemus]|nr:hypothetical protein BGW80DRAFT_1279883 [Lactifluus volemus]